MMYYTTTGKTVLCPVWNVEVTLNGKYIFCDDSNPYIAKFSNATCPIVENSKLPLYKQDKSYKAMFCHKQCELLYDFFPTIDTRKDSYSQ